MNDSFKKEVDFNADSKDTSVFVGIDFIFNQPTKAELDTLLHVYNTIKQDFDTTKVKKKKEIVIKITHHGIEPKNK